LEALQNNCVPSRWLALGHAGCEHVLIAHDLPVPVRVTLPDAAIKNRLGQKELSLAGGSVGQLPHLQKDKKMQAIQFLGSREVIKRRMVGNNFDCCHGPICRGHGQTFHAFSNYM
jgi:hypothetical protein